MPKTLTGFDAWLARVDAHISRLSGLGHEDVADQPWYDWWEDGLSPAEAAENALEDEGFPFGEE